MSVLQNNLVNGLQSNLEMLKKSLADFSDADMLVRAVPTANHTAWQLGHLISSEAQALGAVGAAAPELPVGFVQRFNAETAKVDDPAAFPRKEELLKLLALQRKATIAWVKSLADADMDKPGPEPMRQMIPTLGALALLNPLHLAMHLGQIQVIRRKLGKPVLL